MQLTGLQPRKGNPYVRGFHRFGAVFQNGHDLQRFFGGYARNAVPEEIGENVQKIAVEIRMDGDLQKSQVTDWLITALRPSRKRRTKEGAVGVPANMIFSMSGPIRQTIGSSEWMP